MDKERISCAFNIDTACVEVKYADGSMIAIDCIPVENEVVRNMYTGLLLHVIHAFERCFCASEGNCVP